MFSCLNDLNFGRVLTPAEIDDYLAEVELVHFPLIKKLGRTFITGQGLVELYDLYRSLLLQNALFVVMIYLIMYLYTFPPPFSSLFSLSVAST